MIVLFALLQAAVPAAMPISARDKAFVAYLACAKGNADRLTSSGEPAVTIADVSMTACSNRRTDLKTAFADSVAPVHSRLRQDQVDTLVARLLDIADKKIRDEVLLFIVENKASNAAN